MSSRLLAEGALFVDDVAARLREAGFEVEPFGQEQIRSEAVRAALVATSSPLRWLPDLIAVRGPLAYWVDAKGGRNDTPNRAIEVSALRTDRDLDRAGFAIVLVWSTPGTSPATSTPTRASTWAAPSGTEAARPSFASNG